MWSRRASCACRSAAGQSTPHVRYLQREGTTRDGEPGRLYAADNDAADGKEFTERSQGDRHQFRFIVAPEDGDRLSDLRSFTRDVMRQMEGDGPARLPARLRERVRVLRPREFADARWPALHAADLRPGVEQPQLPTLVALLVFLVGAYAFQGALDLIRSRVVVRAAALPDHRLAATARSFASPRAPVSGRGASSRCAISTRFAPS